MMKSKGNLLQSSSRFRLIGYGLLVLALFDFIYILVPPQLMNPTWEFQTIGTLVERAPVSLLALMLVFSGETKFRKKWELTLLKVLSWGSLVLGVLFLLLMPLLVIDSSRLETQINAQINSQVTQRVSVLQQIEQKVSQGTAKDLNDVVSSLNQGRAVNIKNPQEMKTKLLSEITKSKKTFKSQIEAVGDKQRLDLLKKSAKWFGGVLIAGILFIYMAICEIPKYLSRKPYRRAI